MLLGATVVLATVATDSRAAPFPIQSGGGLILIITGAAALWSLVALALFAAARPSLAATRAAAGLLVAAFALFGALTVQQVVSGLSLATATFAVAGIGFAVAGPWWVPRLVHWLTVGRWRPRSSPRVDRRTGGRPASELDRGGGPATGSGGERACDVTPKSPL